jgi:RimJ/RimL family protein N-acetyltransferase
MAATDRRIHDASIWYQSPRFLVRNLRYEDIGSAYESWFRDPVVRKFIRFAAQPPTLEGLREYWRQKSSDEKVDFLGIFDSATGSHLGNIKFELGPRPGEAHVGFLIGDPAYRRRGLLREALPSCIAALRRARGRLNVYLTVNPGNRDAIEAFVRLGFRQTRGEANGDIRMDYADG